MSLSDQLRKEIRFCMRGAGVSQAEAARRLGASHKHVNQLLTGRALMTAEWAERLTGLCGRELIIVSRAVEAE